MLPSEGPYKSYPPMLLHLKKHKKIEEKINQKYGLVDNANMRGRTKFEGEQSFVHGKIKKRITLQ